MRRIYLPDNGIAALGRFMYIAALVGLAEQAIGRQHRALMEEALRAHDLRDQRRIHRRHTEIVSAFMEQVAVPWLRACDLWPCAYVMEPCISAAPSSEFTPEVFDRVVRN